MKKTIQSKLSIVMVLLLIMQIVIADDTEIFLDSSSNPPDPKVMFLMDNSTSMTNNDGGSQTRMSEAKETLLDIVHNSANRDLDIGVAALSRNYHGGKIIAAISDRTDAELGSEPTYDPDSHGSCTPTQANTLTQKICDIEAKGHTQLQLQQYFNRRNLRNCSSHLGNR